MTQFLDNPPRHFFFTGKGGVGKTSIACATAVHLAHQGKRVLLVSTDPASNIAQVFGATIGNKITPIPQVPGLDALEIDPDEAAEAYRNKILEPVRAVLPIKEIEAITEQLSGSCTTEIASFNEFTDLLADTQATAGYDHVIFDTAPTGHTLLLMDATGSYHRDITRHLDDDQRGHVTTPLMRLQDPDHTKIIVVTLPETTPVTEAQALASDLERANIHPWAWVVNNSLAAAHPTSPLLATRARSEQQQLDAVAATTNRMAVIPTQTREPVGTQQLTALSN